MSGGAYNKFGADIGTAEIADNAVTLAKMASGTDGNLITYDASGDPAAVATGTSGQVLTSNGAGAAPTFQAAAGGGGFTDIFIPPSSDPAYAGQTATIGIYNNLWKAAEAEEGVTDYAFFTTYVPAGFDVSTIKVVWAAAGAGDARIYGETYNGADGESSSNNYQADQNNTWTNAGANTINIDTFSDFTVTGMNGGDVLGIRVNRQGANAADTITGSIWFLGVIVTIVAQ